MPHCHFVEVAAEINEYNPEKKSHEARRYVRLPIGAAAAARLVELSEWGSEIGTEHGFSKQDMRSNRSSLSSGKFLKNSPGSITCQGSVQLPGPSSEMPPASILLSIRVTCMSCSQNP